MIKKGLPADVAKIMETLLDMPVDQLSVYDRAFLRARRDCLTKVEKTQLTAVLNEKITEEDTKTVLEKLKEKPDETQSN
jgi:hypothetical protein